MWQFEFTIDNWNLLFKNLDAAQLALQFLQFLLQIRVFLGHLFILGFPFVALLLESLHLAFVMAGFDIGLS